MLDFKTQQIRKLKRRNEVWKKTQKKKKALFNWSKLHSQTNLNNECDGIIRVLELIRKIFRFAKLKSQKKWKLLSSHQFCENELFEARWFWDKRKNNWRKLK